MNTPRSRCTGGAAGCSRTALSFVRAADLATLPRVSPGGHLVTTAGACAAFAAAGADTATIATIFAGGFLIDVDHAIDYVAFERQRDLRPLTFLRYYLGGAFRRIVLVLHSYE